MHCGAALRKPFRHQFDQAEQHLDRSLHLNANDADILAQISSSKAFLGKGAEGERLFLKALRLNPYRNTWYYPYGAFTYFVHKQYAKFFEMALKGPLTDVWIDLPAFLAAAYVYTERRQEASRYLEIFFDIFATKITAGRQPQPREIIDWMKKANPFKKESDTRHMIQGILAAGLEAC